VGQFNNPEDEDRDGLRNAAFYKTEPPYPADSPRKLHYSKIHNGEMGCEDGMWKEIGFSNSGVEISLSAI
jgi:hypothetical protein